MKSFAVNSFSGGMNNWMYPGLLPENTAVKLIDADVSNGKISAVRYPLKIDTTLDQMGYFGRRNRSIIKWYGRTYWSINDAISAPFYGGAEESLGVPVPESHPDPEVVSSDTTISGTFKYCWCYVNHQGWEGAPCPEDGPLWMEITVENGAVKIQAPASFPETVSQIKVYRTTDKGADFYCIGSIKKPNGEIIDSTPDNTLVMLEQASSFDNYPPPDNGRFLTEYNGVFFVAVDSRIYFSKQGNPHAWPTLNFIGINDFITGIIDEFQGILVFTMNNTYRIVGAEDPQTITKSTIPGNQGCINYNTVDHIANAPIWLSHDGICVWDGSNIKNISHQIIKTDTAVPRFSFSGNDAYYLFLSEKVIVYDQRHGGVFTELSSVYSKFDFGWYDADIDQIFLTVGEYVYQFTGGEKGSLVYLSPYIGQTEMVYHNFMEIVISAMAVFNLTVFIDDKMILMRTLQPGRKRIKLPYSSIGRKMQLQISTQGTLSEYSVFYQ